MLRSRLVPILALAFGLLAALALVTLQRRADDSRAAQVKIAKLELTLNELQRAAFLASPKSGGSPAIAKGETADGRRTINQIMSQLQAKATPPELAAIPPLFEEIYATMDQLLAIGLSKRGYDGRADRLLAASMPLRRRTERALGRLSAAYDRRAETARRKTIVGGIAVIAVLLAAFEFFYRRSADARRSAERFASENERLLVASREEALSDALTGLGNRRALEPDLEVRIAGAGLDAPVSLALFDLDGFKQYNDTFGHPAGDALLARLGARLQTAVAGAGTAYRMGGDEFCLLTDDVALIRTAAAALSETGDSFRIGCSYGVATLPGETRDAEAALQLADQRMYEHKNGRSSASRQSTDVLLTVLSERNIELYGHLTNVGGLARVVAERVGLPDHEAVRIELAAELHDVGKTALPEALLAKPGELTVDEWDFMRTHTIIGERIVRAAPSLAHTADLVRSSHERFDGQGYPDGLKGSEIPLGSRIIAICDAFDVMTSDRPYSRKTSVAAALEELRRCAGSQFAPELVETFCASIAEPAGAAQV